MRILYLVYKAKLKKYLRSITKNNLFIIKSKYFKLIKTYLGYNHSNDNYLKVIAKANNINPHFYVLFPFIDTNLFNSTNNLSNIQKVLLGVLTTTVILLYCIINIVGYFSVLYIIKHTELEKKYPKFSPIIKYYQNTNIIFLIIEIVFVIFILLLVIVMCSHLLYISKIT